MTIDQFPKIFTNAQKVRQFMESFNQSRDENIFDESANNLNLLALRMSLVTEEFEELQNAVNEFVAWTTGDYLDPSVTARAEAQDAGVVTRQTARQLSFLEIIDSLADLLYVTYGFFHAFGLDADEIFEEVHNSNMSKLDMNGFPIFDNAGKVLKSDSFVPPNFNDLLTDYLEYYGIFVPHVLDPGK